MQHIYMVDGIEFPVELNDDIYQSGLSEVLINRFGDLTKNKSWFSHGYTREKASKFYCVDALYQATESVIKNILMSLDPKLDLSKFSLEKYHRFVTDEIHLEVTKRSKRLFSEDLSIDTKDILEKFSQYFNTKMTFYNPLTDQTQWMIARINRPNSKNFNTAHKDIYEVFDKFGKIPRMVNIWIPLSGVTRSNCLPLVPSSHLLPENLIIRTKAGSIINDVQYSVASIKSWNKETSLQRVSLENDELLIFSSHLIHGLAYNEYHDTTRISFEFRLYEEN